MEFPSPFPPTKAVTHLQRPPTALVVSFDAKNDDAVAESAALVAGLTRSLCVATF